MAMEGGGHSAHASSTAPTGLAVADQGYRLELIGSNRFAVGDPGTLSFRVLDERGAPVRDFETEHGARLHLIVVRRDLTGYSHATAPGASRSRCRPPAPTARSRTSIRAART
jgi:hypothetical protein